MGVYTGFTFLMRAGGSMAVLPASVQLMGNHKISLELINFFSPSLLESLCTISFTTKI